MAAYDSFLQFLTVNDSFWQPPCLSSSQELWSACYSLLLASNCASHQCNFKLSGLGINYGFFLASADTGGAANMKCSKAIIHNKPSKTRLHTTHSSWAQCNAPSKLTFMRNYYGASSTTRWLRVSAQGEIDKSFSSGNLLFLATSEDK